MVIGYRPTYGYGQNITIRQQMEHILRLFCLLVNWAVALSELKNTNLDSGKDGNGQKEIIQCGE